MQVRLFASTFNDFDLNLEEPDESMRQQISVVELDPKTGKVGAAWCVPCCDTHTPAISVWMHVYLQALQDWLGGGWRQLPGCACALRRGCTACMPVSLRSARLHATAADTPLVLPTPVQATRRAVCGDLPGDFPVTHPSLVGGNPRWAYYAVIQRGSHVEFDGIAKVDMMAAEGTEDACVARLTFPEGCYGGEAVFVPRNGAAGAAEDDGFLMVYVYHRWVAAGGVADGHWQAGQGPVTRSGLAGSKLSCISDISLTCSATVNALAPKPFTCA